MSRTDKDRPYRVLLRDETLHPRVRHDHRFGECNVGVFDYRGQYGAREWPMCDLYLPNERVYDSPPKWFTDHLWNGPERVRVRDKLGEARKLANAGEMDDDFDFPNYQARNGAWWSWV